MKHNQKAEKYDPSALFVTQKDNETAETAIARTSLEPEVKAAYTLQAYGQAFGDLDIGGLTDTLVKLIDSTNNSGQKHAGAMLTSQAYTLDAIFNNLAKQAINSNRVEKFEKYLKLALRAQSQCRSTWETIATTRNPPYAKIINQANFSQGGPQQVNNGTMNNVDAVSTQKTKKSKNKLMDDTCNDEKWMDSRTTGTAIKADSAMETVEKINGSKIKERKKSRRTQRL